MKKKFLGLAAIVASLSLIGGVNAAGTEEWDKLVKDGVFEAPCVEPTKDNGLEQTWPLVVEQYINNNLSKDYVGYLSLNDNKEYVLIVDHVECDNDGQNCIGTNVKEDKVNVKWKETDAKAASIVNEYAEKVSKILTTREFEDPIYGTQYYYELHT